VSVVQVQCAIFIIDDMCQPDCLPMLELMHRWRESQGDKIHPPRPVAALTQQQFEALTPRELEDLLQDILIVRDDAMDTSRYVDFATIGQSHHVVVGSC
jgi:hypothetical protein